MIPFASDAAAAAAAVSMGVSNAAAVQNAARAPPTVWQYPCKYQQHHTHTVIVKERKNQSQ